MTGTAVFSSDTLGPDGTPRYRYALTRQLDGDGDRTMVWVMLNPSTATATEDDPTIRRCIGFARREKCKALAVVNLYAYRSPSPYILRWAEMDGVDIIGPANDAAIRQLSHRADIVVVAWGAIAPSQRARAEQVTAILIAGRDDPELDPNIYCLGATKTGSPRHPLYLRAGQPLIPYTRGVAQGGVR